MAGHGQLLAINLAIQSQGHLLQECKGIRYHVLRHALLQVSRQLLLQEHLHPGFLHHIPHQPLHPRLIFPHHHYRLLHPFMAPQHLLDLAYRKPFPLQLLLLVSPPDVIQFSVSPPSRHISGAVKPLSSRLTERVGHKSLRCQLWTVQVASRQPFSPQVQLSYYSHRNRFHPRAQHIRLGVGDGPANRNSCSQFVSLQTFPGGIGRILRGPVQIEYLVHRFLCVHLLDQHRRQCLPGQVHHPHRPRQRLQAHQLRHGRRYRIHQSYSFPACYLGPIQHIFHHHNPATSAQRHEDLKHREIKADRRRGQHCCYILFLIYFFRPVQQSRHTSTPNPHRLRPSRRSRGVDQIGQILAIPTTCRVLTAFLLDRCPFLLPANHARARQCRCFLHPFLGQEHHHIRIFSHELQPLGRVAGIQRHVRSARLQNPHQPYNHLQRPLHADPYPHFRPHSQSLQIPRQLIGPPVQLSVRKLLLLVHHRHRLRPPPYLFFEHLLYVNFGADSLSRKEVIIHINLSFRESSEELLTVISLGNTVNSEEESSSDLPRREGH